MKIFSPFIRVMAATFFIMSAPLSASADPTSLTVINLTGPITNFTGAGIRVGQNENGTPTNHLHIVHGLVTQVVFTSGVANDNHATEVASVIISTGSTTRGVAPGAKLYSVGAATSADSISGAWLLATQFLARVINQSAGFDTVTGVVSSSGTTLYIVPDRVGNALGQGLDERAFDALVDTRKITYIVAAANSGEFGTNTIAFDGGAFNIITVGAVSNLHPSTAVADFSARGYLVDRRSKPDIVAPGADVVLAGFRMSTNYTRTWTEIVSNNLGGATVYPPGSTFRDHFNGPPQSPLTRITTNSGTSFAAPHVAGVAALLLEVGASNFVGDTVAAAQDPRTVKAVLLNSATKLSGWSQVKTISGDITNIVQTLDPNQGAGLLNAARAYDQLVAGRYIPTVQGGAATNNLVGTDGWDLFTVSLNLTNLYRVAGPAAGELRLTLDWHRDVGPGPTFSVQGLANLDLYLWSSPDDAFTNLTLVARSVSTNDNVEHLYFSGLPAAYYQFGVYYSNYFTAAGPVLPAVTYGIAWDLSAVPEPSMLLLLSGGAVVLNWWQRQRRQRPVSHRHRSTA